MNSLHGTVLVIENAKKGFVRAMDQDAAAAAAYERKKKAAKDAVAFLDSRKWTGGGSFTKSWNRDKKCEFLAQSDEQVAEAHVMTDEDHVRFRRASARFKFAQYIDDDHVVVMKIRGTGVQVGFAGEIYDPERDGATNAHTMGVWLDTGTCVINSEMVMDSVRYYSPKLLVPFLPWLKQQDKSKYGVQQDPHSRWHFPSLSSGVTSGTGENEEKTKEEKTKDGFDQEAGKARLDQLKQARNTEKMLAKLSKLERAKLAQRQRLTSELTTFKDAKSGPLPSTQPLPPVPLARRRTDLGPKDLSSDQETWIILKSAPIPCVMFDQYGLGKWNRLSAKQVPMRQQGWGRGGFQFYPFVELFCGAQVQETLFLTREEFEMRKMKFREERDAKVPKVMTIDDYRHQAQRSTPAQPPASKEVPATPSTSHEPRPISW